jgi:methionine-rich copper-binding protein CopC
MRTPSLRSASAALSAAALAALLTLAPAGAASAHDSLESTSPEDGATVETLGQVQLSFSGRLLSVGEDQRSAAIQVSHDGEYFEASCPKLVDKTATVDVALGEAGDYDVAWQVVSSDGHTIFGDYTFTYAPASGTAAADGSDSPACGEAAAADAGANDDAILIGAAVGIGAIAVIGVLIAIFLGRRRSRAEGSERRDDYVPE